MSSITDTLRGVLDDAARLTVDAASLAEDDDLYQRGLTSHATVNVLIAVEDAFDVELPDELLRRDTFASIRALRQAVVGAGVVDDAEADALA